MQVYPSRCLASNHSVLEQCGQVQLLAHSLVSEAAAPAQKKGKKRGPQPKVDKGYNGSGVPWEEYKEASKKFSQAVADKELTVRKAAEDALASGVKISKTTIARHHDAKDHPGMTPEQEGAEETLLQKDNTIGNLTKPLVSALIFKLNGAVNGKSKPELIEGYTKLLNQAQLTLEYIPEIQQPQLETTH